MNALLKQAKAMLVVLLGAAGLLLILAPLILMITLKKGVLQSWRGLVVRVKKYDTQSLHCCSVSTGANIIAKEETNKHENRQDFVPGGFFRAF